ncbi:MULTISPECIES: hypothetical protein [unclassified Caballeronia]|uniref:hypothetical protein n=1 Tax=unclassified Caballeronia TaxID=2646786 RepID=UPI002863187F|nr:MULTISPECIES: hypothetical protein [unclassified Caballeronia]MDR5750336.1 hypothetical protein [Caballeronia sp. LZ024]MDR5842632.1 hypothetical protein [Caballeronia sp. LZ031]
MTTLQLPADSVKPENQAEAPVPSSDKNESRFTHGRIYAAVRLASIIVFGIVLPVILLVQAYRTLDTLPQLIPGKPTDAVETFGEFKKKLTTEINVANDYALFSMIYAEQANSRAIVNKQMLKVVIIQVGFAVVSVGLMFIILGINDGGANLTGGGSGYTIDLKTGSTGLVTFIIGAAMAAAGALIPNEYQTVGSPGYIQPSGVIRRDTPAAPAASAASTASGGAIADSGKDRVLVEEYKACQKFPLPEELVGCFMSKFRKRYGSLE